MPARPPVTYKPVLFFRRVNQLLKRVGGVDIRQHAVRKRGAAQRDGSAADCVKRVHHAQPSLTERGVERGQARFHVNAAERVQPSRAVLAGGGWMALRRLREKTRQICGKKRHVAGRHNKPVAFADRQCRRKPFKRPASGRPVGNGHKGRTGRK